MHHEDDAPVGDVALFDVLFEQHNAECTIARLTAVARLLDEAIAEVSAGDLAEAGGSIAMAIELAPELSEGFDPLIALIQEHIT